MRKSLKKSILECVAPQYTTSQASCAVAPQKPRGPRQPANRFDQYETVILANANGNLRSAQFVD
jgi:hypothetical protein